MATLVVAGGATPGEAGASARRGPKEAKEADDVAEERRAQRAAIAQEERDKQRDTNKIKRRLRTIALQRCKSEEEITHALEEIQGMSPEQASKRFDTLMAKADVALVDQVAAQLKNGMGAALDLLLRGRGCITRQFEADSSLQEALANEMAFVADFVNNKMRIAICIGSDTLAGCQEASKEKAKEKEKEQVQQQHDRHQVKDPVTSGGSVTVTATGQPFTPSDRPMPGTTQDAPPVHAGGRR